MCCALPHSSDLIPHKSSRRDPLKIRLLRSAWRLHQPSLNRSQVVKRDGYRVDEWRKS
jgi:hypothetical protein